MWPNWPAESLSPLFPPPLPSPAIRPNALINCLKAKGCSTICQTSALISCMTSSDISAGALISSSGTTRERLISATDRLLAQGGDLDISLREITNAASANVAAVNYHFGCKDTLITEVIERAMRQHAEERLSELKAVAARNPPASLEDVITAWLGPALDNDCEDCPSLFPRIAALMENGASPSVRQVIVETHDEVHRFLLTLLRSRLPELSEAELLLRVTLARKLLAGIVTGAFQQAAAADNSPVTFERDIRASAVRFIAGGLSAAPTCTGSPS
jgi:AcrR family transcriptional regulator